MIPHIFSFLSTDRIAYAKQGNNVLGRPIHPSVCLSVCTLTAELSDKSHYQSEVFLCVSNNHSDFPVELLKESNLESLTSIHYFPVLSLLCLLFRNH